MSDWKLRDDGNLHNILTGRVKKSKKGYEFTPLDDGSWGRREKKGGPAYKIRF